MFVLPGQVVCNPHMRGRHWSALAGWKAGCERVIGAASNKKQVKGIRKKLIDAEARLDIGGASVD